MGVSVCQTPLDQRHDYLGRMPLFVFGARARWQHHSGAGKQNAAEVCDFLGQLRPDATKKSDFQTPS